MKVNRSELLKRLLSVKPGLTATDTIAQSSCVVMKNNRFYTFNREIACSISSGLGPEIRGAIRAKNLTDLLKKMKEEEIEVTMEEGKLVLVGDERRARLPMEMQILLPIDFVEKPGEWRVLPEFFAEAVDLASRCTKRKAEFARTCVHIHPQWVEASDNHKLARWTLRTFVDKSALIRATSMQVMTKLGMTKGSETANWVHFKNGFGLRISIRKWGANGYPDLSQFLKQEGTKIVLPKALADVADRAGIFQDSVDGGVKVSITERQIMVESRSVQGDYADHSVKVKYNGPELCFMVPPKLVGELVEQESNCQISEHTLTVRGEDYIYVTSLEAVPKNGKPKVKEEEEDV